MPVPNPSSTPPNQLGNFSGKTVVHRGHRKFDSQKNRQELIESRLFKILSSGESTETARKEIRKACISSSDAMGACHLISDDSRWSIPTGESTGRVPSNEQLQSIARSLDSINVGNSSLAIKLECLDGAFGVVQRVESSSDHELLLICVAKPSQTKLATKVAEKTASAISILCAQSSAINATEEAESLASILELVFIVEKSESVESASMAIANELACSTDISRVGIGLVRRNRMSLATLSGFVKLDLSAQLSHDWLQALMESQTRNRAATFPAISDDNDHMLLAHGQLKRSTSEESVASHPLITDEGVHVGAWVFAGPTETIGSLQFLGWLAAASPAIASALLVVRRAERGRLSRTTRSIARNTSWFTCLMIPLALVGTYFLMSLPMTYHVRCSGTVEPVFRRFAVAPFDGLVTSCHVRPGDSVEAGDILAEIDGRSIRLELAEISSQKQQSLRKREIEVAGRNIPKAFLAELEYERLSAREKILKFRQDNLAIASPASGVVLSGSHENAEAASVTKGQVLFEVGPLSPIKVQIDVPANELSQVSSGSTATVWIEGQEEQPLTGTIERIEPRSTIRDSQNVFIAEVDFANDDFELRPGMKGNVRIDCQKQAIGWCLFHKPVNYLRSHFTWW